MSSSETVIVPAQLVPNACSFPDSIDNRDMCSKQDIEEAVSTSEYHDTLSDTLSDVVVQLPDGWPNISQLLVRHSWDFTSVIHPSVNKALSHLNQLHLTLAQCIREGLLSQKPKFTCVRNADLNAETVSAELAKSVIPPSPERHTRKTAIHSNTLSIQGVGQRPPAVAQPCSRPEDVIEETVTLLARLEKDRQETLASLLSEREKAIQMGLKIDQLAFKRMVDIPVAVQREHESCASDLSELNWYVRYRGRAQARIRRQVDIAESLNSKLLGEISQWKENMPLMEEKLALEKEAMAKIQTVQNSVDEELRLTLERFAQATEKSNAALAKAYQERTSIKNDLDDVRNNLAQKTNALANAGKLYSSWVMDCKTYAEIIQKHREDLPLEIKRNNMEKERETKQKEKVNKLEKQMLESQKNCENLEAEQRKLDANIAILKDDFTRNESEMLEEHVSKEENLHLLKCKNGKLEMEKDTLSRKIKNCDEKKISDGKELERIKKTLEKTMNVLEETEKQTEIVDEDHHKATLRLQQERKRCQMEEDSQKSAVDMIKKSAKDELHRKMVLKGRIEADSKEFEKIKEETKSKMEMSERRMEETKRALAEVKHKVVSLSAQYEDTKHVTGKLQNDVQLKLDKKQEIILNSASSVEELTPKREEMRVELEKYEKQREEMVAKTETMSVEIESMDSTTKMINKASRTTEDATERLQSEFEELSAQLAGAQRLKNNVLKSINNLSDRDALLENEHREVICNRQQVLDKLEKDLSESKNTNKTLASTYRHLQNNLIRKKEEFVRKFEARVRIENDIKDLKQMLSLQTRIHAALQEYYKYRHLYSTSELLRMQTECKNNGIRLTTVNQDLDSSVSTTMEFLHGQLLEMQNKLLKTNATHDLRGQPLPKIGGAVVA